MLIIKHDVEDKNVILKQMAAILNNGYTYQIVLNDILIAFKNRSNLNFNKYSNPCDLNLIKQGVMYYHKELKIMSPLPVVVHDIDAGTLTSEPTEFYVEPVASYTIDDLLKYFYSKNMADTTEYNSKRMQGMFKYMIQKYGIDKLLFMIEHAARMFDAEKQQFSLTTFDSFSSTASRYLEEIKNNCKYSGSDKYVPRKRVLFS